MSRNYELMQQTELRVNEPVLAQPKTGPPAPNGNKKDGNKNGNRIHFQLDDSANREESFKLVQNIFLLQGEIVARVVVFAGIDSGDGCSAICARAANSLASLRLGTVCLVDANVRAPSLPEYFGVDNHHGLTDALSKPGAIREFTKVIGPDNLSLLSRGSLASKSPCLLNGEIMKARIAELRKEFDYVLIDSPPLNTYSDGVTVARLADGLVLVLEVHTTRREAASKVRENLRAAQIKVLGAVLLQPVIQGPRNRIPLSLLRGPNR